MNNILLLFILIITVSCGTSLKDTTVFYKQKNLQYKNLKGENCIQSGIKIYEKRLKLVEYYKNCNMQIIRKLESHELKYWGIKPH
jgi:hypothetical protein